MLVWCTTLAKLPPQSPMRGGCLQRRSTVTVGKSSSHACYCEKVHFQVTLSLTPVWR